MHQAMLRPRRSALGKTRQRFDCALSAAHSWWDHVAMEQDDDPEKRIAELERLQRQASAGRAVEQPPYPPAPQPGWPQPQGWRRQPQAWRQPVGHSGYVPPPTYGLPPIPQPRQSGRPRGRFRAVFTTIILGIVAVGLAAFAGHTLYAYGVGTPATAKVVSCTGSGKHRHCTGTWTIDGATHTGKIDGNGKSYRIGSIVDVHVYDGTAYTLASVSMWLWAAAIFVGLGALGLFGRLRKRRRTR